MGCRRVSPGCVNCYIEFSTPIRVRGLKHGQPRLRTSEGYWKQPLKWDREHAELNKNIALTDRPRIFPSLCDWLDDEVPIEWLADFLKLIHDTPNLDWLLLTKRPENFDDRIEAVCELLANRRQGYGTEYYDTRCLAMEWGYLKNNKACGGGPDNVWLGVSVEDQKRADERIPALLKIPAKVRFLSVEPLLEAVDLSPWLWQLPDPICANCPQDVDCECGFKTAKDNGRTVFDWVIVGGESGSDRRDCGVKPIVDIATQCQAVNMPVFVKQDCAFKPSQQGRIPNEIWDLKQFPQVCS